MMKWTRYWLLMPVLMVQALSSCSLIDEPEYDDDGSVKASLAFSVSQANVSQTRMADPVVQKQGNERSYRGLGDVYMIPFAISGTQITSTDHPLRLLQDASLLERHYPQTGNYGGFYLYNVYTLIRGINAFLVYGRASTNSPTCPSEVPNKVYFGSLQVPELINPDLNTLRFSPDPIYPSTKAPAEAQLLADYLTFIAQTPGWSSTTDETLKLLYKVFTGQENDGTMVMAGASVNVMNHVNALSSLLNQISFEAGTEGARLKTEILKNIETTTYSKTIEGTSHQMTLTFEDHQLKGFNFDYPAKYNLPDGAAALRWAKLSEATQNYGFVAQTVTTTLDNINNIDRWCYPPELFYYVNSRIDTSNDEDFQPMYGTGSTATTWTGDGGVLEKYENKDAFVSGNTKGVAIKKPLNYAVGRLKVTLQKVTTDKLTDDAGKELSLLNSSNNPSFPLTSIIICNQHPVGFDFKPVLDNGAASHADDHFIYDSQVGTSCCLSTEDHVIPSTLVLQSYDTGEGDGYNEAEEVTIALEFRNDSGTDFRGKGGVIYPGTKFYLMGKIDPTKGTTTDENARGRVFTQDYITTITTSVNSLANAYNVLPNMLGGRLELGVELTPNWIQAETDNVILE